MRLRAGRPEDAERLREVERAAGAAFRDVDLAAVADDEPPSAQELRAACVAGQVVVAEDEDGVVVAYLLQDVVDGVRHVEQVSVAPQAARRGIGAALIDHVAGDGPVTLTTFRDVPWNAPYYARLGFRVLGDGELGPGLRAVVAREAASIPGGAPRVAMRRG